MKLRIMTFNVQHFRNYNYPEENRVELPLFADYIAAQNADIVGLNEVYDRGATPEYEKQAFQVGERAGYKQVYFAEAIQLEGKYSYGNAILSKYPFEGKTIPVPNPPQEALNGKYAEDRCVLKAKIEVEGRTLTVLCCHFGLNDAEGNNAVETICKLVDECTTPLLVMGDFNFTPASPILAPLYARLTSTDHLFGENNYTFPSDNPQEKIDYIFTRDVRVLCGKINREVLSDHNSLCVEIEL